MKPRSPGAVDAFNRDVVTGGGYQYTTQASLSSRLANRRLTEAALQMVDFAGRRVLDVGCGDGTYTFELFDAGHPAVMVGLDPADQAIRTARTLTGCRNIRFDVGSAYAMNYEHDAFDVAHLRGVLHHLDRPEEAIREALRVAREIIVIEPNGYNLVLKLLENFSSYHIEHGEKSYRAAVLKTWTRRCGGDIHDQRWAGLVPFFCPDWMAGMLKIAEPLVERAPLVNAASCAVFVFRAGRYCPECGDWSQTK